MHCDKCKFWNPKDAVSEHGVGLCHRFPPQALPSWPDVSSARYNPAAWAFPITAPTSWCGEFVPKSEQLAD